MSIISTVLLAGVVKQSKYTIMDDTALRTNVPQKHHVSNCSNRSSSGTDGSSIRCTTTGFSRGISPPQS